MINQFLNTWSVKTIIKKDFSKDLNKNFRNTYEYCDTYINKVILLLRKAVYSYEYMDSWERFDEELLPRKKIFTVV